MWQHSTTRISLHIFNAYRFLIATIFFIVYFFNLHPSFLGSVAPDVFIVILSVYWAISILMGIHAIPRNSYLPQNYIVVSLVIDLSFLFSIMHLSGGVVSGLGILFLAVIAAAAILLKGPWVYFFATLSTFLVLGEQLWIYFIYPQRHTAFTHASILGSVYLFLAWLVHDVSERLDSAENSVDSLLAFNQAMLSTVHTGFIITDQDHRVLESNDTAKKSLPLESGRLPEPDFDIFRHNPEGRQLLEHYALRVYCLPFGDRKLFVLIDEKEEIQQAHQLRLTALGKMASSIAHEIRNPLSAISQASQLMAEDKQYHDNLNTMILDNVNRVDLIIESVLNLSRSKRRQTDLIDLKPWLEDWVYALTTNEKTLTLMGNTATVELDTERFRQVITNLIHNAFQEAAVTHVSIHLQPSTDVIFVTIEDNGNGVSSDIRSALFDPFFTTRSQGTGLGLSIAKSLCDAEGIKLYYVENPQSGATFRLEIPL